MLFSWLRKPESIDIRLNQFKSRLKGTKQRLIKTLEKECERLDHIAETGSSKYPEDGIAKVLLAAGQYYQFLKLNSKKAGKRERALLEYLSPTTRDKQTFHGLCSNLYQEIEYRHIASPMLKVRYNDLMNAYMYLLEYLLQ